MAILKKKFYLGVEGGATKSTAILVDENDGVLIQRVGNALNYHYLGKSGTKRNLAALLNPLLKKTKGGIIYVVFGLAGLDTPKDAVIYTKIARSVLPKSSSLWVVNDTKIALELRCPEGKNRILVISGTGSSVYGENGKTSAKSVGWGVLLGDEGSGYDIGTKILKAAMRSFDGRGKKTILESLVPKRIGVKTMEDTVSAFHKNLRQTQNMKRYVASFADLLDEAIMNDDRVAMEIRQETIEALMQGISAVARRLAMTDKEFCLGYTGSVWKTPDIRERFEDEIKKQYPKVCLSKNNDPSVWGAVLLAKKLG